MDYAVTDASYRDFPAFIVAHDKLPVCAMTVGSIFKVALKLKKVFLKIKLEGVQFSRHVFAFFKTEPALPQSVAACRSRTTGLATDVALPDIF